MEKKRKVRFDDPNAGKLRRAKGERTLVLNGEHWYWTTDGYDVYIRAPNGKKLMVDSNKWFGVITPGDIKQYIDEHMGEFK